MTDAIRGQYVGFKYLKGVGEYAIEVRIPRHEWSGAYDLLGDPPGPGESKWLGVAVLKEPEA
jgi:hypothetical protein